MALTFLITHWRVLAIALVLAGAAAAVGVSRHQLANARLEIAEYRRAYDLLTQSLARQNAAILEAEQKAKAAQENARRLRDEARGAIDLAQTRADRLARVLSAPRPAGDCPVTEALEHVRADLRDAL